MKSRPSKRNIVAGLVGRPGLMEMVSRCQRTAVRILAYHRVLPASSESGRPFMFDEGVISAATESFYRQMDYVRRDYDVISFKDLLAIEEDSNTGPRRPLIITFDDGYRDNYTEAFPVLKEFGIPATIFLSTGHMRRRSLFWWDLVAFCFKSTEETGIVLDQISSKALPLGSLGDRRRAIELVLGWMKRVPEAERDRFATDLPGVLEVVVPSDIAEGLHLSWDEIREMSDHGIEFGSHTVTHPVLSNVEDDRLEKEVFQSKEAIERELGREAIVFSYPVGGPGDFDNRSAATVARAGYRYAVSYVDGVASSASNRFAMPRIHVEADHSLNLFRANLRFPGLMLRRRPALIATNHSQIAGSYDVGRRFRAAETS